LLLGRVQGKKHGVVIYLVVVYAEFLQGGWLVIKLLGSDRQEVEVLVQVGFGVARDGVVRRMGTGKSDL
jgi:hypothetical protein